MNTLVEPRKRRSALKREETSWFTCRKHKGLDVLASALTGVATERVRME
ncbi:MAG: hypothetical protein Q8912_12160 [Bacillota bacterium]|nr:hypothetical protein [Bacillota bacterium]